MKFKGITNLDVIALIENTSELFRLGKYKSKKFIEQYIGLGLSKVGFYGLVEGSEVTALKDNQTVFDSPNNVDILIEGVVELGKVPVNNGAGNIVYQGYGILEVNGTVIYDGRIGTLTATWGSINGTLSNQTDLQNALDAKVDDTEKGAALGVATLDATGKLPTSQLPISAMEYKGAWNASTNSPALSDGVGTNGDYYLVSADGSTNLDGQSTWEIGDAVIFNGTLGVWQKVGKTQFVLSDGSGTTANGIAIDLGGALTSDASITGVGGTLGVNYGLNNASDYLQNFNIYATQGSESYDAAFGGTFLGTIITKNPAGYSVLNNAGGYNAILTADPNGAIIKTLAGTTTSEVIASSTITRMRFDANGVGSQWTQSELATTFVDNTVAKKGIEYSANYSATFVPRSLVDKEYVDNVAAAIDLNSLTDVTTGLPGTPTEADDGKILFYDHDTGQWITDDAVTHGTSVINCKKSTAGTIAKGLPVYLVGFDADLHTVELADATSGATMPVIGFTAEALDNTNSKHVTTFGKLTGIDTTSTVSTLNPNGETWAVNDALYISTTAGGLTKVRPTGGTTQIQRIAKVLKVDATGGQIFVFNTARTAGLPNLGTDKLWIGDANGIPQEVDKSTLGGTPALNNGEIFVGDVTNSAVSVPMSGDVNIDNTGLTTIQPDSVTYDKMQDVSQAALLGSDNPVGGTVNEIPIVDQYLPAGTITALLENTANWDINGNYTGTAITGTFQGQSHYDGNYWFTAVADNVWIRLIRG